MRSPPRRPLPLRSSPHRSFRKPPELLQCRVLVIPEVPVHVLNEHLAAHGFPPANPDVFGQENSHTRGWSDFIDETHTPSTHVEAAFSIRPETFNKSTFQK